MAQLEAGENHDQEIEALLSGLGDSDDPDADRRIAATYVALVARRLGARATERFQDHAHRQAHLGAGPGPGADGHGVG